MWTHAFYMHNVNTCSHHIYPGVIFPPRPYRDFPVMKYLSCEGYVSAKACPTPPWLSHFYKLSLPTQLKYGHVCKSGKPGTEAE